MGGRQNASSEVLGEGIDSFRVRNAVLVLSAQGYTNSSPSINKKSPASAELFLLDQRSCP
jgi:hypothetical protein